MVGVFVQFGFNFGISFVSLLEDISDLSEHEGDEPKKIENQYGRANSIELLFMLERV